MTNKEFWKGIIPALLTPLKEDFSLDIDGLNRLLENNLNAGCEGIFVSGSTGEPTNLTTQTWIDLVRETVKIVNGRVPICCGVICPGTAQTIEKIKVVEQLGIDFVSCTPNFYARNEYQEDIVRHYEELARKTTVKMMVYNNLDTTGVNILAKTFFEISKIDNVIAYKDTRSDWENHLKVLAFLKDKDISLISGGEYLIGASFLMGSQGNIAAASNIFPKLFVALYKAAKAGDIDQTLDLSNKIATLNDITRTGKSWLCGVKYAAQRLGLCQNHASGNVSQLDDAARYKVDQIIEPLMIYR